MDKPKRARSLIRRKQKNGDRFPVQIGCAESGTSVVLTVNVKPGTTIREVFELSGIQKIIKGAKLIEGQVGIFGEIRPTDTVVRENDRIELYRPLAGTPGEARKKRLHRAGHSASLAEKKKTGG